MTGGILSLVGDDLDNVVTFKVETTTLTLTPDKTTDVGKGPGVVNTIALSTPLTAIRATLAGGSDQLTADASVPLVLPTGITAHLGSGNNTLTINTQDTFTLGTVSITAQDGQDDVTIVGKVGSRMTGPLSINGGSDRVGVVLKGFEQSGGAVSIRSSRPTASVVSVSGVTSMSAWKLAFGTGFGSLSTSDSSQLGAVSMSGDISTFIIAQAKVASAIVNAVSRTSMDLGSDSTVSGALAATVTGPNGSVSLSSFTGPVRIGNLSLTTRGRDGSIGAIVGANAIIGRLSAQSIGAHSAINMICTSGTAVTGTTTVRAPAVGSTITAQLSDVTVGGIASIAGSAIGGSSTEVSFTGSNQLGGLSVIGGVKADVAIATAASVLLAGDITVTSKTGDAIIVAKGSLTARNLAVTGDLSATLNVIDGGSGSVSGFLRATSPGTAEVNHSSSGELTVSGDVTLAGAITTRLNQLQPPNTVFQKSLSLRGATVELRAQKSLFVGGPLTAAASVTGIYEFGEGSECVGDVTLSAGNGFNSLIARGTRFVKSLAATFGDGSNVVELVRGAQRVTVGAGLSIRTGNLADQVLTNGLIVSGQTIIETQAGVDTVIFDATTWTGSVSLSTGAEDDVFRCNDVAIQPPSPTQFLSLLSADLGDGDDSMKLGRSNIINAGVVFGVFGSRVRGGRGHNTFNPATAVIVNPSNVTITDFVP